MFRIGSRGAEVGKIQEQQAGLGFFLGPLDGAFGGGTLSAVKAFQQRTGRRRTAQASHLIRV